MTDYADEMGWLNERIERMGNEWIHGLGRFMSVWIDEGKKENPRMGGWKDDWIIDESEGIQIYCPRKSIWGLTGQNWR